MKCQQLSESGIKLIEKLQNKYNFNLGQLTLIVVPDTLISGTYYKYAGGHVITLPATSKQDFKEMLFHEVGHIIYNDYDVKKYRKFFINKYQSTEKEYTKIIKKAENYSRLPNFVSGYARVNNEEDFCETFSSVVNSPKKWKHKIRFNDEIINLIGQTKLKAKVKAIKEILNTLEEYK